VFGESVLNDAVSIVLFNQFQSFYLDNTGAQLNFEACAAIAGKFIFVSGVSLLIGLSCGMATSKLLMHTNQHQDTAYELVAVLISGYLSFFLAELGHLSGIVSIFFCGIANSHYSWYNISTQGKLILPKVFHTISHLMETMIFAYLGMSIFSFSKKHQWNFGFICFVLGLCYIARAVGTFPLSAIANLSRRRKISCKEQVVLWFAGLRGAIAFALAIEMTDLKTKQNPQQEGSPHSWLFVTTTLVVVLFTTFVNGGLTAPLLKVLKIENDSMMLPKSSQPVWRRTFKQLDRKYFRRFLVNERSQSTKKVDKVVSGYGDSSDLSRTVTTALAKSLFHSGQAALPRRNYSKYNSPPGYDMDRLSEHPEEDSHQDLNENNDNDDFKNI